jgi:hypothetical protein
MNTTVYRFGVLFTGDAKGIAKAAKEAQASMKAVGERGMSDYKRMAKARETLGVRSEREIQREVQRTQAAYNRLARSGTQSWNEQRMAARKMREEVTRLTNEMGRLTTRQKIAFAGRGAVAVGAGVGLATAMVAPRVQRTLDYDRRLANMANTAYADRDLAGRRAGMGELDRMLIDAVRYGGGTRDGAGATADSLLGAGIFKPGEIATILREAVKAGTASGADSALFAQMAIAAKQTMGITPDRMGAMFGMGTYAGQQGGFEIRDMARWLPSQMAAAKAVGMYGEGGFAKLAALNQAAAVTAGTRDEAGNNVVNLLAKLSSTEMAKNFRDQGVDLPRQLAEGRMKGQDAVDVLGNLLVQQLAKDKNYQAVQKQLAGAKGDEERGRALQAVGSIAQGTMIGKVLQDRQAMMALYGYVQNRDRVSAIASGAMGNTDAASRNFDLISSTSSYKVEQAKNEAEIAQTDAFGRLTPAIDALADRTSVLIREYPLLTTAIGGATVALTALAGSAAAAALMNGGKIPGLGGMSGAAGRVAGMAGRGGLVGLAGAAGYGVGSLLYNGLLADNAAGNMIGRGTAKVASFFGNKEAAAALQTESLSQRMGGRTGATGALPRLQQDLQGAIDLNINLAPGLMVDAQAKSNNPRIPFRTDVGRTNTAAGF